MFVNKETTYLLTCVSVCIHRENYIAIHPQLFELSCLQTDRHTDCIASSAVERNFFVLSSAAECNQCLLFRVYID